MFTVSQCPLPHDTLLHRYENGPGHHTDCFETEVAQGVSLPDYIEAFFNSPILRIERKLLGLAMLKSNYDDVVLLAQGRSDHIAGWQTEDRADQEILLTVMGGGVRTWLKVIPEEDHSRLLFGSAVVPPDDAPVDETGAPKMAWWVQGLMGFHRLYSHIVLGAAKWQLKRMRPAQV